MKKIYISLIAIIVIGIYGSRLIKNIYYSSYYNAVKLDLKKPLAGSEKIIATEKILAIPNQNREIHLYKKENSTWKYSSAIQVNLLRTEDNKSVGENRWLSFAREINLALHEDLLVIGLRGYIFVIRLLPDGSTAQEAALRPSVSRCNFGVSPIAIRSNQILVADIQGGDGCGSKRPNEGFVFLFEYSPADKKWSERTFFKGETHEHSFGSRIGFIENSIIIVSGAGFQKNSRIVVYDFDGFDWKINKQINLSDYSGSHLIVHKNEIFFHNQRAEWSDGDWKLHRFPFTIWAINDSTVLTGSPGGPGLGGRNGDLFVSKRVEKHNMSEGISVRKILQGLGLLAHEPIVHLFAQDAFPTNVFLLGDELLLQIKNDLYSMKISEIVQ